MRAWARRKRIDFAPLRSNYTLHNHLRNALAALNVDRRRAQIDCDHVNFAAIIRIDGSRTVHHRQSLLEREPAAWPDLGFEANRQSNSDPGGNHGPLHRRELPVTLDIGAKIHAGRAFGHVCR